MKIEEILNNLDDISEPASFDKILLYSQELLEEDEMFIELLVNKLSGEMITWYQPWYQQSNSLSRPLKEQNCIQNETSEQYRRDTVTKAEHKIMMKNWKEFIELFELPDKLVCLARWRNTSKPKTPNTPEECARRYAVSYLARGLERTIYQVFRHIMTKFGGAVKGAYSPMEEKIMKVCFEQHPNNCVPLLSAVLNREPRGIYKRLHQLYNGKPEKIIRLKKTTALATKLINMLLLNTGLSLEQLKYKQIDNSVWLKIGEEFDYPYVYLRTFWYNNLHVQLFAKTVVKINRLRKQAFRKMKLSSCLVWTDIRWKEFYKDFPDGVTPGFLYRLCVSVVQKYPKYLKKPLHKVVDYALVRLKRDSYRKRRLKTLEFTEDGTLRVVRHT